jgi:hypothetical protein
MNMGTFGFYRKRLTQENREYGRRDPSRWPRDTLYPQKLAITSPTSSGRSVGIVRSRTQTMEFSLYIYVCIYTCMCVSIHENYSGSHSCICIYTYIYINWTPWSESASELYRPSDRRFSAKWLPTFADKGCHVVSVIGTNVRVRGFNAGLLARSQLHSEGPGTGQLDQGFPWFSLIPEQMLSWYPNSTLYCMLPMQPSQW